MAALRAQKSRLSVNVTYWAARRLVASRQARQTPKKVIDAEWHADVSADRDAYADWRYRTLHHQFTQYFGAESAKGKVALDFGCGDGALCIALMDARAERVHGVDLAERSLAQFAKRLSGYTGERRPTFSRSTSPVTIDEPDETYDAIYCLDTLEHVIDYRAIILEWHRILRPAGCVYIWWQPYWHPFGHHRYDWMPIPWAHAFLTEQEMDDVCAKIVDWPDFNAPIWDRNPDGTRKNRFRVPGAGNFLNKLTTLQFERTCRDVGFLLKRREFYPFTWPQPAKAISALMTKVPIARDFFMACAVYQLMRNHQ